MKQYTIYHDNILTIEEVKKTLSENHLDKIVKPLKNAKYSQAWRIDYINKDGKKVISFLQSYNTLVCCYIFDTDNIYCIGTFSQTTRKHINNFCIELNEDRPYLNKLNYYHFKEAVKNNNIKEYVPIY